jgi:hypothetical protein
MVVEKLRFLGGWVVGVRSFVRSSDNDVCRLPIFAVQTPGWIYYREESTSYQTSHE